MWTNNYPYELYIDQCRNYSYMNLIFIIAIVLLTFLGIFFEFTDHSAMMDIPQSETDCKTYGCYPANRIYWRVSLIAAIISSLLTSYVLYMFGVRISIFIFIIILLLIFLTIYSVFNFLTNHFFDEICYKSG